ncbi:MAG: 5-formyltetrahydrofolate cyclo-ligase [Gammaproteobacteria bacterium]|nr:5-formyltetrahydrofolate cyclo-ligase [Gammaproteobacteria bacterium]
MFNQPLGLPAAPAADADWSQVRAWRRRTRALLQGWRAALAADYVERVGRFVRAVVEHQLTEIDGACIALYWPFRGEIDLRPLAGVLAERARDFALPVVANRGQPLEFRRWWPGMRLARGVWDIPVPADGAVVVPDVLLVPLLGYDAAGYRLGYGGGYYDRTLAGPRRPALAVGIGYAGARLETIRPQPHDVPMDLLLTDDALVRYAGRGPLRAAAVVERWSPAAVPGP